MHNNHRDNNACGHYLHKKVNFLEANFFYKQRNLKKCCSNMVNTYQGMRSYLSYP